MNRAELILLARLRDHGYADAACAVTAGVTSSDERKQRMREVIVGNGISGVIASTKGGKPKTYRECFALLYGEEL